MAHINDLLATLCDPFLTYEEAMREAIALFSLPQSLRKSPRDGTVSKSSDRKPEDRGDDRQPDGSSVVPI